MIPHIIQERSIEQDIHHTGEVAPCAPIHGGGEQRRRTSRPWLGDRLVFLHREVERKQRSSTSDVCRPGPLWVQGEGAHANFLLDPCFFSFFLFLFFKFWCSFGSSGGCGTFLWRNLQTCVSKVQAFSLPLTDSLEHRV